MSFTYQTAKMLAERINTEFNGRVTRGQLSKLLREATNTMDPRWIKKFAESMDTAGLIYEIEPGIFAVVKHD